MKPFKNATDVATEYTYNKNGAMAKYLNKGITGISYNSLNLPQLLSFSNTKATGSNTYTYLADGRKVKVIQKLTSPLASTLTTKYIGNKVYESSYTMHSVKNIRIILKHSPLKADAQKSIAAQQAELKTVLLYIYSCCFHLIAL